MSTDLKIPTRPARNPPSKDHSSRKPPVRPLRWLNTTTFQLENARAKSVPDDQKYAILSHTWEDVEIDYQDFRAGNYSTDLDSYRKIHGTCEQARNDGIAYVWADMCCINKDSSAELSESINSMYAWYAHAAVCYVYLSDVPGEASFASSKWFTRGWTLQELLAPAQVVFFDQNWSFLGTKETLSTELQTITGIDKLMLLRLNNLEQYSIAQRMSWAVDRVTTRLEDRAYSLLGIFDVNMPMLYGEGDKAFFRLQEEIIKQSDDHTIFAWPVQSDDEPGLLATSPDAFRTCSEVVAVESREGHSPYTITNRGLSITLPATPFETDTYLVRLDCLDHNLRTEGNNDQGVRMACLLRRLEEHDQYARVHHHNQSFFQCDNAFWDGAKRNASRRQQRPAEELHINVRQHYHPNKPRERLPRHPGFRVRIDDLMSDLPRSRSKKVPAIKITARNWNPETQLLTMDPGDFGYAGTVDISALGKEIKTLHLGFDFDYNPLVFLDDLRKEQEGLGLGSYLHEGRSEPGIDFRVPQAAPPEQMHFTGFPRMRIADESLAWAMVERRDWTQGRREGEAVVKGDRVLGVSAELGARYPWWFSAGHEFAGVVVKRVVWEGMLVWEVRVVGMRDAGNFGAGIKRLLGRTVEKVG